MKIALIAILAGIAYTASANQCDLAQIKKAMLGSDQDDAVACYGNGVAFGTAGASFVNLGVTMGMDEIVLAWRQDEFGTSWKDAEPERQEVPQSKLDSNNCDSQNFFCVYGDYDSGYECTVTGDMQWKKGQNGGNPTITDNKKGNTYTLGAAPCDKIADKYPDKNFP